MSELVGARFVEPEPARPEPGVGDRWPPAIVRAAEIEAEISRLVQIDRSDADLRRALVVHPRAGSRGQGLAPGIQVSLEVLRPGERALPAQRNSCSFAFCVSGSAKVDVDGHAFTVGPRDVWNAPPMAGEVYAVDPAAPEPLVFLRFSNAALLELLGVHWTRPRGDLDPSSEGGVRARSDAGPLGHGPGHGQHEAAVLPTVGPGALAMADGGPWHLQYERLIDPVKVAPRSWLWPWELIRDQLDPLADRLDQRYRGRRVCLLYDPATGRHNGTTFHLVASLCVRPAGIVDRPHRHVAAAVNYFFQGSGWSTIDGQRIEWAAGDLMLAAPGWTAHHHASDDEPVFQMAVQDNPLHLAMGSLLWQESLDSPPRLLGIDAGYQTNRHELDPADV